MTAYTPLEILLLFQSLLAWGTESITFSRISDALKKHELINEQPTYDPGRLSSDALRELYKERMQDEGEGEVREDGGNPSPAKKRKLQSPTLATNEDRHEHREKLARIVNQSYKWYTQCAAKDIREDERRYAMLEREIQELEARESERAAAEMERQNSTPVEGGSVQRLPSGEFAQPERIVDGINPPLQTKEIRRQLSEPSPPARSPSTKSDGFAISDLINDPTPSTRDTPSHSRNGSHSSQNAYPYPTGGTRPPPLQTASQGLVGSQNYNWPHQASPSPLQYQHPGSSYSPQFPPPFSPSQHTPRGSFSGPSGISSHQPIPSSPLNTSGRNSAIQLPPIGSLPGRSSASPARSLDTLAELAGQQTHIPSYPIQQGIQTGYGGQNYNNEVRPLSGNGQSAINPQLAPINTQAHLPPLYPSQQSPSVYGLPPRPVVDSTAPVQQANFQYNSPYNGNGAPPASSIPSHLLRVASMSTPSRLSLDSQSSLPRTPAFSTPQYRPKNSTGKGTRWKGLDTLLQELTPGFKEPRALESPAPEPLSPVLPSAKLRSIENRKTAVPKGKKNVDKPKASERTTRGKARADSVASSVVPDSTRSESVMSQADEMSVDGGVTNKRRAKRAVATPRGSTTPRGSIEVAESIARPPSRQKGKRKRDDSPEPPPRKPGPATHVIWTRNFHKISASALETVTSHRNASTFSQPVKDRDAPQYSSLIKYPRDLKSIRTAIHYGNRAANAAASGVDPNQTKVRLPIADDIIPPHGIVNNQQLEKELSHMFANAVMYNPSPEGFVPWFKKKIAEKNGQRSGGQQDKDNYEVEEFAVFNETKAMSKDVDAVFEQLRAAERPGEASEQDRLSIRGGSVGRGVSVMRGASVTRGASVSRPASLAREVSMEEGDGEDGDGTVHGVGSVAKRRRRG